VAGPPVLLVSLAVLVLLNQLEADEATLIHAYYAISKEPAPPTQFQQDLNSRMEILLPEAYTGRNMQPPHPPSTASRSAVQRIAQRK